MQEFNVSCRYAGVFHVEKNGRYSLTRSEAVELCRALNSTLATLEQLKKAHDLGFETCRYGFVVGHIVIPRINPYPLCAANNTGIYKLSANTTARYDAYCYNETETADKTCEPVVKIDTSLLSNQDETVIDNADGSRYNPDGTRHTGGESSTSGVDEENAGSGATHETTPMDASIRRSSPSYYGTPAPVSQLPDQTLREDDEYVSPSSSSGTVTDVFREDDGQHTASPTDVTSSGSDSDDEDSSEEMMYPTVFPGWGRSVAKDKTAPSTTLDSQHGTLLEITTQDHWSPTYTDEEEQYSSSASRAVVPSPGAKENDSEHDQWMLPGWDQREDYTTQPAVTDRVIPSRDSNDEADSSTTVVASPDDAYHEEPTQSGVTPWDNEAEMSTEGITNPTDAHEDEFLHRTTGTMIKAVNLAIITTVTASTDIVAPEDTTQEAWEPHLVLTAASSPDGAHHQEPTQTPLPWDDEPGQGTEGTTNAMDTPRDEVLHRTTASVTQAGNGSPLMGTNWLIIVVALVVLALILAVCIAVNSRRRCGQKQKLVINNGKGAVEDRKTSELNGDISKSQEMVHLVHKEQSNDRTEACDEFLTVNETQNHHEFDMKTGV
ncbi:CD44 antigen isoform X3 [Turdus rufiventris]|nr:CD44 antigen isoform X3 [Turdus rufiventris]